MKRLTIKDIAAELGVSITTVSLIINNRPCRVSDATRLAVQDLVKKYNYKPNSSARALITKKTQTIGLIVPDVSNPFFAEFAKGVTRAAHETDLSVILCNSDSCSEMDINNTSLLIGKQVDGIIFVSSFGENDQKYIDQFNRLIMSSGVAVILADRKIPGCHYSSVLVDHRKGGYLATNALIKLGHRNIGCITGPAHMNSANERYMGYLDALRLNGIDFSSSLISKGDYSLESGLLGAKDLIIKGVSAIFASNDLMAIGASRQAGLMGYSVGVDFSIIGFDNIPLDIMLDHPLSTVHQPVYQMGEYATKMLVEQQDANESSHQTITMTPKLILRATTAKNRALD